MADIPFNRPYMTGQELGNITKAHQVGRLAGDGRFSKLCEKWLEDHTKCQRALLTHSCTAALEMAALLLDLQPKDEVIMPSYTFVSTANAFALRGAVPVFVDIRPDTLNIDERLIEAAITPRTKAIVVVHYAGVACDMDAVTAIANKHGLSIIEDAAQAIMASYKGRALGSIGDFGALSFHETKNIQCGEGGALLINASPYRDAAEIIREKGTDRSRFFRGEVDKYTWQSLGSSYLPGELLAAFLYAQMHAAANITAERLRLWDHYHHLLAPLEVAGKLRRPFIPDYVTHSAHMYYILLPDDVVRLELIRQLKASGIDAVTHYVPLHSSPAGKQLGRVDGELMVTDDVAGRLLRLPLWMGLDAQEQDFIVSVIQKVL
ncbi:MAG: dTDP-4-amino-4,6-dideoxygalactose transaminase [Alphaproteobacteria bacterium]